MGWTSGRTEISPHAAGSSSDSTPPEVVGGPTRTHLFLAIAGTVLVIGLLVAWAGGQQLGEVITTIPWQVVVVAFLLQALVGLVSAYRILLLVERDLSFGEALAVAFIHAASLLFAPFRSGEVVYILLIRWLGGRVAARGLSQLVILRVADLLSLAFLALVLLWSSGTDLLPDHGTVVGWTAGSSALVFLVLSVALVFRGAQMLETTGKIIGRWGRLGAMAARWFQEAALEFRLGPLQALLHLLLALGNWSLVLFSSAIVLVAAKVPLAGTVIALILALQRFLLVVPLPALGTFGPVELSWTAMAVPLGVSPDLAVASILAQHALVGLFAILLAVLGGIYLFTRRGQR